MGNTLFRKTLLGFLSVSLAISSSFGSSFKSGEVTRNAVGMIETHGAVRVGGVVTPSSSTLFAGDRVQTESGGASVRYRQGDQIILASESIAAFNPSKIQLEKGLMTFQTTSVSGIEFSAATLRLEPSSPKTSVNVTLRNNHASVAVSEGSLNVVDPSGIQLASLRAGEARMFEEAPSSSAPSPAAAPASPAAQKGSMMAHHKWLIVGLASAITAGAVGAGLAMHSNDSSNNDSAELAALREQAAALQASATALQTRIAGLNQNDPNVRTAVTNLQSQLAQINTLQQQLPGGNTAGAAGAISQINNSLNAISGSLPGPVISTTRAS